MSRNIGEDFLKAVTEALSSDTFSLILVYVVLLADKPDLAKIKNIIDKTHLQITLQEYAHFKYAGTFRSELFDKTTALESSANE